MARNPFEHLSVLIVDDNGHMRQIIETALRAWGIGNIHMAADGAEGLNVLRTIAIDFVLTDLNMGVLDGFDFVRMVRTADDSPNPYVPIIVISATTDLQTVTQARDAGMTEFLAKPVTPRTLYDRLVSIIQRPRPFIRSKKYFGPDRRRHLGDFYAGPTRRENDGDGAQGDQAGGELSSERVAEMLDRGGE